MSFILITIGWFFSWQIVLADMTVDVNTSQGGTELFQILGDEVNQSSESMSANKIISTYDSLAETPQITGQTNWNQQINPDDFIKKSLEPVRNLANLKEQLTDQQAIAQNTREHEVYVNNSSIHSLLRQEILTNVDTDKYASILWLYSDIKQNVDKVNNWTYGNTGNHEETRYATNSQTVSGKSYNDKNLLSDFTKSNSSTYSAESSIRNTSDQIRPNYSQNDAKASDDTNNLYFNLLSIFTLENALYFVLFLFIANLFIRLFMFITTRI